MSCFSIYKKSEQFNIIINKMKYKRVPIKYLPLICAVVILFIGSRSNILKTKSFAPSKIFFHGLHSRPASQLFEKIPTSHPHKRGGCHSKARIASHPHSRYLPQDRMNAGGLRERHRKPSLRMWSVSRLRIKGGVFT